MQHETSYKKEVCTHKTHAHCTSGFYVRMTAFILSQKSKENVNNHRRYLNKMVIKKRTMKTGCPDMVKGPFGRYNQAF